jgi:hypothetical protein
LFSNAILTDESGVNGCAASWRTLDSVAAASCTRCTGCPVRSTVNFDTSLMPPSSENVAQPASVEAASASASTLE